MKQEYIINEGNSNLILFFAGWGMDATPFKEYKCNKSDFIICYDYRTLDFDFNLIEKYKTIELVAWSMGVWIASQINLPSHIIIKSRIAINGTMHPIDEKMGIPPAIYGGTLNGLCEASLRKFQLRMCGSNSEYKEFLNISSKRSIDELKEELVAIEHHYQTIPQKCYYWDEVYIALNDRIFPAVNQETAWNKANTRIIFGDEAHYNGALFKRYLIGV